MTIEQMRKNISRVYSGVGWKTKVDRMEDSQVLAVYYSFLKNNRFQEKKKIHPDARGLLPRQLTFDDILWQKTNHGD